MDSQKHDRPSVDRERILSIIDSRLAGASRHVKEALPTVLQHQPLSWFVIDQPEYLMVGFLTPEEKARVTKCMENHLNPFPGLITAGSEAAFIRLDKSRYITLDNVSVSNYYALSLGPDSTALLKDHHQSVATKDAGTISYTVPLAYIVSYGNEIDPSNVYEYFDELVAHSVDEWRKPHATGR